MAKLIVSVVVNREPWEIRRLDEEGWFHRRPGRTMWLGGLPPGASIEEVEAVYEQAQWAEVPKSNKEVTS
jgi:hypothetical protein